MSPVQRWVLRLLWLRYSYRFRWAHKPLCKNYAGEVFYLGRIALCRSCCCVYCGLAAGAILAVLDSRWLGHHPGWFTLAALLVLVLSGPWFYKKLDRWLRDLLRFFLGLFVLAWLTAVATVLNDIGNGLRPEGYVLWPFVLLPALALLPIRRSYASDRRKRKHRLCLSCSDYRGTGICPGYALQSIQARCYEERATAYLLASGYLPAAVGGRGAVSARRVEGK